MMNTTGIIRSLDKLGRIVLPMEMRRSLGLSEGTEMEFYVEEDSIILRKYLPGCVFCGSSDKISEINGIRVCYHCAREIPNLYKEGATL